MKYTIFSIWQKKMYRGEPTTYGGEKWPNKVEIDQKYAKKNLCSTWVQTTVAVFLHVIEKLILEGVTTPKLLMNLEYICLKFNNITNWKILLSRGMKSTIPLLWFKKKFMGDQLPRGV